MNLTIVSPRNTAKQGWVDVVGRCGHLGGVKSHIKAFEKVKQSRAPCKVDAGGNSDLTLDVQPM